MFTVLGSLEQRRNIQESGDSVFPDVRSCSGGSFGTRPGLFPHGVIWSAVLFQQVVRDCLGIGVADRRDVVAPSSSSPPSPSPLPSCSPFPSPLPPPSLPPPLPPTFLPPCTHHTHTTHCTLHTTHHTLHITHNTTHYTLHTTTPHNTPHHHHQASPPKRSSFVAFCVKPQRLMMDVERDAGGGTGSARRRRERRLRSMLRHERMSVAMALAESAHHSARRRQGPGERHELYHTAAFRMRLLPKVPGHPVWVSGGGHRHGSSSGPWSSSPTSCPWSRYSGHSCAADGGTVGGRFPFLRYAVSCS